MRYPNFVYGSYQSQSLLADCERCVNFYPEQVEAQGAPWSSALYPTPGQRVFLTVTDAGTRALFSMNNRMHAVVGSTLYEVFATATATSRGTVAVDAYPAQITYNGATGNQNLISSGSNAYLLNLTTNMLTQVLTGDATMVAMIDTYFLAFNIKTSRFRWSNLNDGLTWQGLNFSARTVAPDPWQAMVADGNRQLWLIGEQTGEVQYDTGSLSNPFQPIPGAVFGYGTKAPFSVKVAGDRVIWLSQSADGAGIVVSARGYAPQRVSNHAVETAIAGYARTGTITDAEALVYQDQGHWFYALTFPTANKTHVLDTTTNVWHDRVTGTGMWAPRVHAYAFGQHLVGDRLTGSINTLDTTIGTEADGSVIRRLRIPPPLWLAPNAKRLFVNRFDLAVEPGLGASAGQGSVPTVMLRTSRNAKTWSNIRTSQAGAIGRVDTRVFWTRCASSTKLWVPEITVSDPIPWRIMGAELEGRGFGQEQSQAA